MLLVNKVTAFIILVTVFWEVVADLSNFRILAPEFVCPNAEGTVIEKLDNTVITVKTDVPDINLSWSVRWKHLDKPTQRFTLLVWKTVRALETKLNAQQPEPLVYLIDNAELLQGVEYIFTVTASDSQNRTTKTFSIDNIKGDSKLLIDGRSEKLSVLLIGGETVYADMEYIVEAEVSTCSPTQDYYFVWSVQSSSGAVLNVSETSGSRLEITPYTLQPGASYYVSCTAYRNSGEFITQTGLPFRVLYRGLEVYLSFDVLVVSVNSSFDLEAVVYNHDFYGDVPELKWSCIFDSEPCENFESLDNQVITFINGLPNAGRYEISLEVTVQDQQTSNNLTVYAIENTLPVIQVVPQKQVINEYDIVTLVANASSIVPSCTLTWYFANEDVLSTLGQNSLCDNNNCQHGEVLPGSLTIFSLEENFLHELTDFTNGTEWRQIVSEMEAESGRARFVVQCDCSFTFNCDTQGSVYADVNFKVNEGPQVGDIMVSPETGTAMETVFRVSTLAASDLDKPLRYSFYCSLGNNETLMLASNLEHFAVATLLPYIDTIGTKLWVEVCDSLGACTSSEEKTVQLLEGNGRTVQALVDSMRGHVIRCEMMMLRRVVQSTVTTYINANQAEALSMFTSSLLEYLSSKECHCIKRSDDYYKLIVWLNQVGVNTSEIDN